MKKSELKKMKKSELKKIIREIIIEAKLQKIGTINATTTAIIYDKNNKVIGKTIDTPNAIAYALSQLSNAAKITSKFGGTITQKDKE